MHGASTPRSLPSRATLPSRRQTHLSALCLCVTKEMSKPFLERTPVCTHTDWERQLVGTWCTPELLKAIEKGYTAICVHEVWHFLTTRRGLFKDYVNTWLKIKEEASGLNWTRKRSRKSRTAYASQDDVKLHVG